MWIISALCVSLERTQRPPGETSSWKFLPKRQAEQIYKGTIKFIRRLKNDKKFVYELNRRKFFSNALASFIFRSKTNSINDLQVSPCYQLAVCDYIATGIQKFGPTNQITGKKSALNLQLQLILHTRPPSEGFFLFIGGQASLSRDVNRMPLCLPAGGRPHPSAHIHTHAHKGDRANGKGARRRIISQTLTKMCPCGLCLRLHEFSIPSLPNWHPGGGKPGKRASIAGDNRWTASNARTV